MINNQLINIRFLIMNLKYCCFIFIHKTNKFIKYIINIAHLNVYLYISFVKFEEINAAAERLNSIIYFVMTQNIISRAET